MVLAQRRRPFASGIVFGIASAMKFTAWPLAALALFAACYAGGPFVTLWRINRAVSNGDLDTLRG